MTPLVWIGAVAAGVSMGLMGTGGSILTIPILIYLVGQPPKLAIASSLAVVGGIALISALNSARQHQVDWRSVLLFGVPGVGATYAGAMASGEVNGAVQLMVFALVMALAAYSMLKPGAAGAVRSPDSESTLVLVASGAGVGLMTGFVGVGGGFLLVPALVMMGGLRMYRAVGTALFIVFMNAGSGFYKHAHLLAGQQLAIDWGVIIVFLVLGVIGSIGGNMIAHRIPQNRLRWLFGWFLIVMCGFILWQNVPKL